MGYFRIMGAIPGFFLSSLFVMLFSRAIAPELGLAPFDYPFAMLVTIALWLAVVPLVSVRSWWPWRSRTRRGMPWMMERCFSNSGSGRGGWMSGMCSCMDKWEDDDDQGVEAVHDA